MQMPINDNFNYEFKIGIGLGDISFDMGEKELLDKLKTPKSIDVDIYEKGIEETKRLHYTDIGLMISISMYDGVIDSYKNISTKINSIWIKSLRL